MDDSPSPLPYALLAVAIALGVVLLCILPLVLIVIMAFTLTPTTSSISAPAATNRLAVIDNNQLYTIDPDGSHRNDLASSGQIPTAALIWSRNGQRLIYAQADAQSSRVISARPDGSAAVSVYEGDPIAAPFYLYGAPDDAHVAFLTPDPNQSMALRIAPTDRAGASQAAVRGQPNYWSWSPDGSALLVHVGGASGDAFLGEYVVSTTMLTTLEHLPAAFQAPGWSPTDQTQRLYARRTAGGSELVVDHGGQLVSLVKFDDGIIFGWSPDGQTVAYALNTPSSFLYNGLAVIDQAGQQSQVLYHGDILAFFWSPDGQRLAFLTGALMEPGNIGRTGGLAAPRRQQRRTLQATWHVVNVKSGAVTDLTTFEPSADFLYVIQYFDQFAQSIALWSPDSRWLVYAGQPLGSPAGVYIVDTRQANPRPQLVGPGQFAIWSWK